MFYIPKNTKPLPSIRPLRYLIRVALCVCGGFLGLHHFYNKNYSSGILRLLLFTALAIVTLSIIQIIYPYTSSDLNPGTLLFRFATGHQPILIFLYLFACVFASPILFLIVIILWLWDILKVVLSII